MTVNSGFKNSLYLSAAAHVTFAALLLILTKWSQQSVLQTQSVEISLIEEVLNPAKNLPEPKLIVETDSRQANEQLTEKAKFLSEKNNFVEKETKAKTGQKFQNAENSRRANALPQAPPVATKKVSTPQTQTQSDVKKQIFETGFDAYSAVSKKMQLAENLNAQQKANRAPNQMSAPSAQQQQESTTNDHLENVEDDLMTRLNTREYKYYGYYNRIKNQLNQWWVPQVQQKFTKMMRQGRTIASEQNKVTKLIIVLNGAGNLVKVQVLAESGVRDLDDAAVEAFRQAAPFPNPPKGMIEKDGHVRIRWDCIVES